MPSSQPLNDLRTAGRGKERSNEWKARSEAASERLLVIDCAAVVIGPSLLPSCSHLKALNSTESEEDAKLKLELEGRTQGADAGMVIAGDFFKSCGNGGREKEE